MPSTWHGRKDYEGIIDGLFDSLSASTFALAKDAPKWRRDRWEQHIDKKVAELKENLNYADHMHKSVAWKFDEAK